LREKLFIAHDPIGLVPFVGELALSLIVSSADGLFGLRAKLLNVDLHHKTPIERRVAEGTRPVTADPCQRPHNLAR
jgi:hypothetical protein